MKARLLITLEAGPTAPESLVTVEGGKRFLIKGTEIEHADCWKLVRGGFAEPIDEECKARAEQIPLNQRGVARMVHERIMREYNEFQDELEAAKLEDEDDE